MQLLPLTVEAMMEEGDREEDICTIKSYCVRLRSGLQSCIALPFLLPPHWPRVSNCLYFIEHYMQPLGGNKYWAFLDGIYFTFTVHPMYNYY